ncbi:MAG TPA: FkbM family methyltransferase [Vicinamibacterales bacterium]|nr:FkbM family methyltransferase [Vicinamibacterales bacterium]
MPLFSRALHLVRRAFGTVQLAERQQWFDQRQAHRHDKQIQAALALGNAITLTRLDSDRLKNTTLFQRCAQIIDLLSPMDVDAGYVRLGKHHDGGYVMVDDITPETVDAAYGFGISRDVSWDQAIAARGISVLLFDHLVREFPPLGPRARAFKVGITGHQRGPLLQTLGELVAEHGHGDSDRLILKMDVEGAEWDVLNQVPGAVLDQFRQIVIEFHGLTAAVHRGDEFAEVIEALRRLNVTHQSVHVHGNCARLPLWVGPLVLPDLLEVTFVRRRDWTGRLSPCRRQFPTELDEPSIERWPDIFLGSFSVPR